MRDKNNTRRSGRHVDQCRKWSKILRPKRARSSATGGNQGRKGRLTEDKRKIFRRRQEEEEGKDKQATKENSGSHTGNNHSEERRGKQVRRQVGDTRQQWETEERQGSRQIGNKLGDKRPPKKNGKQAGRQDQKSSFPLRHPFQERKNPNSIVNSLGKRRGSRTQAGKKAGNRPSQGTPKWETKSRRCSLCQPFGKGFWCEWSWVAVRTAAATPHGHEVR